jgi:magnesium transporter
MGGALKRILKESLIGLLNGSLLSTIIFCFAYVFGDAKLGMVVSVSLLTVIVFASMIGTLIPLVLNHYKIDPAIATGPFITTLNDVVGLFIYFTIGMLIYGL